MTDNNPLSHLQSAKLGAIEQRWTAELALFDLIIKYRPGKLNGNADALSRHPVHGPSRPEETEVACCQLEEVLQETSVSSLPPPQLLALLVHQTPTPALHASSMRLYP